MTSPIQSHISKAEAVVSLRSGIKIYFTLSDEVVRSIKVMTNDDKEEEFDEKLSSMGLWGNFYGNKIIT